jgi:hypothetical protein
MKIPETLKIGGHNYRVRFPYRFNERGDIMGQHDGTLKEIKIDDCDCWTHAERSETGVAVTFLHEILHACDQITGHEIFKGEDGEKKIEAISESLFQVLRDNKLRFDEV